MTIKKPAQLTPATRTVWLCAAAILVLCLLAFWPSLSNGFVFYDDDLYLHRNPVVKEGLTLNGILWAIRNVDKFYWHPITLISHMTDVSLFGLEPAGHHATSMVIHALNGALLFLALWRLTDALWPAALAAALHSLHPLRVESVAWVAERKDVLSGLFFSATLLAYAHYARWGGKRAYWLMLGAAAAAYASKPTVVILPAILLLLDWWPLSRFNASRGWAPLIREKAPLFVMSALVSLLTVIGQREDAMMSLDDMPLYVRLATAVRGYYSLLFSFLYPADLGVLYPHERIVAAEMLWMLCPLVLLSAFAWFMRRRAAYVLVGWGWFLIGLLPTSGIAQSGQQAYADRFTYIPAIGLAVVVAFGAADLIKQRPVPVPYRFAAGLVLAVLAITSWNQTRYWKNAETMLLRAIEVTRQNPETHQLLGDLYLAQDRTDEALEQYRKVVEEYPAFPKAYKNIASLLVRKDRYAEALRPIDAYVKMRPKDPEGHKLRALTLIRLGRNSEAAAELQLVLRMNPADPQALQWLASIGGAGGK